MPPACFLNAPTSVKTVGFATSLYTREALISAKQNLPLIMKQQFYPGDIRKSQCSAELQMQAILLK